MYSIILGLDGFITAFSFINLINTLVTNILSRKQEFAMMQAIGMSKKTSHPYGDLGKRIPFKASLICIGIVETLAGFFLIRFMQTLGVGVDYFHYHFPTFYFFLYDRIINLYVTMGISRIVIRMLKKRTFVRTIAGNGIML